MIPRFALTLGMTGLLSLSALEISSPAQASILNGGFETNSFSSWSTFGTTTVQTSALGSGPTAGTYQALLQTVPSDNYVALEQFLGLSSGSLDALGYGETFGGSAIKQSFTVNAGDTLSFDWNFLTNESSSSFNNDFAFLTLGSPSGLADTNTIFLPSATAFSSETGFKNFSRSFSASGTYTLGIGVVNVFDGETQSGVLVDNVVVSSSPTSVPTPALFPGLLALGIKIRRSKNSRKSC